MQDGPAPAGQPGGRLGGVLPGPLMAVAGLVLVLGAALLLREISDLVVPVLFGLFLALVAWPLVVRLERRGMRHALALTTAGLVVLAVVIVAAGIIAFSVAELVVAAPEYEARLRAEALAIQELLAGFGIVVNLDSIKELITPGMLAGLARPVASAISGGGLAILVMALTLVYALAGAPSMLTRAERAFGERHQLLLGMEQFGVDLRRYLLVRALLGLFAAVLVFILLLVLGIPLPALWAFLVFAASFIPNIGTFIALIPPVILAWLEGGLVTAGIVVIGYTLINVAQDQFLQPIVMGSELNLTPLVVFLAVVAWAWILGAAGALLAVPLTVGLVAIMEAFPESRPLAALMRNKLEPPPGSEADPDAFTHPGDEDAPADTDPSATSPRTNGS